MSNKPKVLLFMTFSWLFTNLVMGQRTEVEAINALLKDGGYVEAGERLKPLQENRGNDFDVLELSGDLAAHQKKWKDAAEIYSVLLDHDSGEAVYHFKYAASLAMKAIEEPKWKALLKVPEIERHLLKAAQLDSQHVEVRWALIELYLQLPSFLGGGEEIAWFYAAELKKISKVDGYLAKGHISEERGDLDAAESHYLKAVEIGGSLHCYDKLSNLYLRKQQPGKAFSIKEKALEEHGKNQLRLELGEMAAKNKLELEKGKEYVEAFLSNYSSLDNEALEWAYFWKSRLHFLQGQRGAALKAIEKSLLINGEFEEGRTERRRLMETTE